MVNILYEAVYEDISRKICSGELRLGEQLPTLKDICGQYGISNMTAMKVLEKLNHAKLVKSIKGKGSFVCHRISLGGSKPEHSSELEGVAILTVKDRVSDKSFYGRIVNGIFETLAKRNLNHRIDYAHPSPTRIISHKTQMFSEAEGVIMLSGQPFLGVCMDALEQGARAVLIDCIVSGISSVVTDNFHGMSSLLDHLESLGHRRIALGSRFSNSQNFVNENERVHAFQLEIGRRGMEGVVVYGNSGKDFAGIECLLSKPDAPTAFMFTQDSPALRFMRCMKERGWRIPEDFSVLGFDGHSETETGLKELATYNADCGELGRQAVESLFLPWQGELDAPQIIRVKGAFSNGLSSGGIGGWIK